MARLRCTRKSGDDFALDDTQQVSLCEALDRVLNKGVVIAGEATLSIANIDLIYLGLQVVVASMETARGMRTADPNSDSCLRKFE